MIYSPSECCFEELNISTALGRHFGKLARPANASRELIAWSGNLD